MIRFLKRLIFKLEVKLKLLLDSRLTLLDIHFAVFTDNIRAGKVWKNDLIDEMRKKK